MTGSLLSRQAAKVVRVCCASTNNHVAATLRRNMSSSTSYNFENLSITQPSEFVFNVELNRPKKMNALSLDMWNEIGACMDMLAVDPECRVIVLSAAGKMFCSGIDLNDFSAMASIVYSEEDIARKTVQIRRKVKNYQDQFTKMELCDKPIIAAVHNACVGGAVDLLTATDIRLCSADAWFQIKEVDMGLAADVGTLQRLPKVIGSQSLVADLCLTARRLESAEALSCGLVSRVLPTRDELMSAAMGMAADIAAKSPVAVQMTKRSLVYSRDHTVQEGLDHIASYNMSFLQSEDVVKSAMAAMDKSSPPPQFAKL